jgi:hypothetical protein
VAIGRDATVFGADVNDHQFENRVQRRFPLKVASITFVSGDLLSNLI